MKDKHTLSSVSALYHEPLFSLVGRAHATLREHFVPGDVQASQLLSIKTGGCSEDCVYCSQSSHYQTGLRREAMLPLDTVVACAKRAKEAGATRFCMGAAWRQAKDGSFFDRVLAMVRAVNALGLQVCCTLGMLSREQATRLKEAGLYAYNHNIDTSERHYKNVVSTHSFQERLRTIDHVRAAGITVCTGGILGLGEDDQDRISFLHTLATLHPQPESVTINQLVPMPGTPLEKQALLSILVVIRVIAVARIIIPKAVVRLSAGRISMSHAEQFLAFYAGANSIFLGEKLLTSPNPSESEDKALFADLSLRSKVL